MSIQQNFPAISPTLSLNFARSKTLDPRITFTRTTAGTRTNETGLIEVVSANTPRFDHSYDPVSGSVKSLGLLIEEQRVNLINYNTEFKSGGWYNSPSSSISSNSTISPDGNLTASKWIFDTQTGSRILGKQATVSANTNYTCSIFAKSAGFNYISLFYGKYGSPYTRLGILVNLNNGSFSRVNSGSPTSTSFEKVEYYGNGWYRIEIGGIFDTTSTDGYIELRPYDNTGTTQTITGDGTSGIYIWGAQLEEGSFPTSYIPTSGSTATRTVDAVSMAGTNFSSWFNQTEGTLFADFMGKTIRSSITYDRYIAIVGNDPNLDEMGFYTQTSSGGGLYKKIGGNITNNAVSQNYGFVSGGGPDFGGKAILAYKSNDASYTINGVTPDTDNTVDLPTFVELRIFGRARYQPEPSGHISQFIYYPKRLPDTQLINLTK